MKDPRPIAALALAFGLAPLAACDRSEGPVEETGEAMEEAGEEAKDAAEEAADEVEEATDEAVGG